MTPYQTSYSIRYSSVVQQQIEVAGMTAAQDIINEDPATADHANRLAWAQWYNRNSSVGMVAFAWPVAMNTTIQAAVAANQEVKDSDIQFVVNSALPQVITDFIANKPLGA